jgi:intracellular multiplication protein IcmL
MAFGDLQERYAPRENSFYRNYYAYFILGMMLIILFMMSAVGVVLYQMFHRPLPAFDAAQKTGQKMLLQPFEEPNLLPDTLLRWASKAATVSYTFDFNNYNRQIASARPYYTEAGWRQYISSVTELINTIAQNQLFVNGIVSGAPVISNQGEIAGRGYIWRIQIPFLVTYQSANVTTRRNFLVVISVMRVPPSINPQGIGIDQFVMIPRG